MSKTLEQAYELHIERLMEDDVVGNPESDEWAGTICPICHEEVCDDMAECQAEYEDIEDEYVQKDQKKELDYFKAIW